MPADWWELIEIMGSVNRELLAVADHLACAGCRRRVTADFFKAGGLPEICCIQILTTHCLECFPVLLSGLVFSASNKRQPGFSALEVKAYCGLRNRPDARLPPETWTAEAVTCGLPVFDGHMYASMLQIPRESGAGDEAEFI